METVTRYQVLIIRNKLTKERMDTVEFMSKNSYFYSEEEARSYLNITKKSMIAKGWVEDEPDVLIFENDVKALVDTYYILPFNRIIKRKTC